MSCLYYLGCSVQTGESGKTVTDLPTGDITGPFGTDVIISASHLLFPSFGVVEEAGAEGL